MNKAFQDRIAFLQQEKAALEAAADAETRTIFRVRGRDTDAGRRYKEITAELEKLQAAQGSVSAQSEYLQNVQNGLVTQARALTTEITDLRSEIDGRTGKSVLRLRQQLSAKRAELTALQTQIATNANALRALTSANTATAKAVETATSSTENYALTLAKLRANAEDARDALNISTNAQQLAAGFQAAITASNAYYNARIAKAQETLAQETAGTEAYNNLQTRIFELGRQRLAAQRQIEAQRSNILRTSTRERVDIERSANNEVISGLLAVKDAVIDAMQARLEFAQQIAAIPRAGSPDAQYGNFTSGLRRDFQETERQGRSLLDVMREIARITFGPLDLDARIPDPDLRQLEIDERIAAEAQGAKTINDIRQAAGEQGRQFLQRVLRDEQRDFQRSLRENARQYRQFTNLVSNTFIDLATGRARSFETVATAFIQQSLRIVFEGFRRIPNPKNASTIH